MDHTYWHKQTPGKPLFPNLIWSRPETKSAAGKLLIVGGNLHGFAAPAEAYNQAATAGIGMVRVVLPDSIQKMVGSFLDNAYFVASTPSGSLAKAALAELLEHAAWADGVLLAGDLGRNSETAVLLESFITKYPGPIVFTKDAVDNFYSHPLELFERSSVTLVVSLSQLQQLASKAKYPHALRFQMDLLQLVEWLHEFSKVYTCHIVVKHQEYTVVASDGQVSTTRNDQEIWRLATSARAAVWLIQQPRSVYEAITTSLTTI